MALRRRFAESCHGCKFEGLCLPVFEREAETFWSASQASQGTSSNLRLRLQISVTQSIACFGIDHLYIRKSLLNLELGDIIQCYERHDFTMLAHRIDQENIVHGQQTAAAAKPLNGAKTPATKAPKTPFRGGLNDENAAGRVGKSVLKTNGKGQGNFVTIGKKDQQLDKSAFATPAGKLHLKLSETRRGFSPSNVSGPTNRAPLGFKTTNAKAIAFQTPAIVLPNTVKPEQLKTQSPRLRRPKVKIHQAEVKKHGDEEDGPEIEYMPPKPEPLPDLPSDDDFGPNKNYSTLEGANLTRGWESVYLNPLDDDGIPLRAKKQQKADEEHTAKELEQLGKVIEAVFDDDEQSLREYLGLPLKKLTSASESVNAHSAAVALAQQPPTKKPPSYAAPTAATKARKHDGNFVAKPGHARAVAVSKSTLSYGKGRAVSATLKAPTRATSQTESANANEDDGLTKKNKWVEEEEMLAEMFREQLARPSADEESVDGDRLDVTAAVMDWDDEWSGFQMTLPTLH